jgi:hypothetical protein
LHNIVKYITVSPQRIKAFEDIKRKNSADGDDGTMLKLVKDNFTRWNYVVIQLLTCHKTGLKTYILLSFDTE